MARTNLASGFAGFLIGIVTGCAICAAAAVFITNSPIPFVEKVQKVTADVDPAQKLAGGIDPNRALNEQQEKSAEQDDSSGVKTVTLAPPVQSQPQSQTPAAGAGGRLCRTRHCTGCRPVLSRKRRAPMTLRAPSPSPQASAMCRW